MIKRHVPVTILSGFLGSGKTTLLNRILDENKGVRYALIINEFGSIGLDADLLRGTQQDFVQMDNGCLCCALNEELVKTLEKLATRDDYDAVILETTGIADPLPIAWTFLREQYEGVFRFAGIVTVVDSLHLDVMLSQAEETRMQIERADFLYLAKTDVASDSNRDQVLRELALLNAQARVIDSRDPDALKLMFDETVTAQTLLPQKKDHHHAQSFDSVAINLEDHPYELENFEDFFEALPKNVFRAKAVFRSAGRPNPVVMHAVCGRVDFYEDDSYVGVFALVLIGRGLDAAKLKASFQSHVS